MLIRRIGQRPDNGYRTQRIRGQWEQRLCILQHDNAFSGSLSSDIQRLRIAISRQRFRFGVGIFKKTKRQFQPENPGNSLIND